MKKDRRIQLILNQIVRFSTGDFDHHIEVSDRVDAIDAISAALNALGDILKAERKLHRNPPIPSGSSDNKDGSSLSEKILKGVFDSRLIGIVVGSAERGVLGANDMYLQMSGYSREDLVEGKIGWNEWSPEDEEQPDIKATSAKRPVSGSAPWETKFIGKDNIVLPVVMGTAGIGEGLAASYMINVSQQKNRVYEIFQLNKHLEQDVKERAEQLDAAHKELDTFSRAISHDLRAPLRALHGYSQILTDQYAEKMDANGLRLLNNIKASAKKMGRMVDDLVSFSRIGKTALNCSHVRLNAVVDNILNGIDSVNLNKVDLIIQDLGSEMVDPALIQLAFQSLIDNAIKYSHKREKPCVEIGVRRQGELKVYFVKDNGVGFDMQYSNMLFGVSQRLHSEDEFDGTGVGLALVQRIIFKHGGRIWAEGKVDKGAIFYFTLNANRYRYES